MLRLALSTLAVYRFAKNDAVTVAGPVARNHRYPKARSGDLGDQDPLRNAVPATIPGYTLWSWMGRRSRARILELALYHSLGKLPEPELTYEFF
jgi:hypothetical protein